MTPTMPSTHPCPDLEDLAAFVDGLLAGAARAAVIEHLASCEDCYEVYAETLRVGEELEDAPAAVVVEDEAANDDDLAPVVRHPRSFRWVWPAAAALAAAAAVVLVVRLPDFLSTSGELVVAESGKLVPVAGIGAQTRLLSGWEAHDWSVTRGQNPYEYLTPEERSFRVGVRVVDLRSALVLDDRDVARSMATEITQLLAAEELGFQQILYEGLDGEFGGGAPTDKLIEISTKAEKDLAPEAPTYFKLGKWVEAARLAALTRNVQYFESGDLRRDVKRLQEVELSESLRKDIGEFEDLLQAGANAEALTVLLEDIIALRK